MPVYRQLQFFYTAAVIPSSHKKNYAPVRTRTRSTWYRVPVVVVQYNKSCLLLLFLLFLLCALWVLFCCCCMRDAASLSHFFTRAKVLYSILLGWSPYARVFRRCRRRVWQQGGAEVRMCTNHVMTIDPSLEPTAGSPG